LEWILLNAPPPAASLGLNFREQPPNGVKNPVLLTLDTNGAEA